MLYCSSDLRFYAFETLLIIGQLKREHGKDNEEPLKKPKLDVSDVDVMDIGRFVSSKHAIDDDTKFNIINNHWHTLLLLLTFLSASLGRKKNAASFLIAGLLVGLGYAILSSMTERFVYPVCYLVMRQDVMAQNCLICSKSL